MDIETVQQAEAQTVADDTGRWTGDPTAPDEHAAFTDGERWYTLLSLRPITASTVTDSLGSFFSSLLPEEDRILGVYWMFEGEVLRVWTAIEDEDFEVEMPIYEAQVRFIEKMSDLDCDFSVIYRQGRELGQLLPTKASLVA